jgi:hypothetical protein
VRVNHTCLECSHLTRARLNSHREQQLLQALYRTQQNQYAHPMNPRTITFAIESWTNESAEIFLRREILESLDTNNESKSCILHPSTNLHPSHNQNTEPLVICRILGLVAQSLVPESFPNSPAICRRNRPGSWRAAPIPRPRWPLNSIIISQIPPHAFPPSRHPSDLVPTPPLDQYHRPETGALTKNTWIVWNVRRMRWYRKSHNSRRGRRRGLSGNI